MVGNSLTDLGQPIATRAPAAGIFLSYRRNDPDARVGRLYDRLVARFGDERVFRDVDQAEPGTDFVVKIDRALSASRVLIAVMGPTWETVTDPRGERRLNNPNDYVRHEIAQALRNDDCTVLPVLWGLPGRPSTMMPAAEDLPDELRPLVTIQAIRVEDDDGQRFEFDSQQVVIAVGRILGEPESELGPDIVLTPPDLILEPGDSEQITIAARNVGNAPAGLALIYDGPDWARLRSGDNWLAGGREIRNSLVVSPPRKADLPPGTSPFFIELRDQVGRTPIARASGSLTALAFHETEVRLEPARVQTRRSSSLSLTVRNGGNAHLDGRVETTAKTLNHESQERITLQPGAEETYEISVSAPTRRFVGRAVEHPVTVSVAVRGERERHVRRATLRQRPLLSAGVVIVLAAILVALAGFGAWRAFNAGETTDAETRRFPYLLGREEADAKALLGESGFDLAKVHSLPFDAEKGVVGVVVRTDPKVDDQVRTDAPIQLFLGEDSLLIDIPDVAGMTEAAAIDALRKAGFTGKLTPAEQVTTEVEPGQVIETDPPALAQSLPEDEIKISVAKVSPDDGGSTPGNGSNGEVQNYTIPNVEGQTWDDAADKLDEAHFEPSRMDEASETVDEGFVISTDPAPGTVHPAGTNVTVIVSTGPSTGPDVAVPSVVGFDVASAEQALQAAGLVPSTQVQYDCDASEEYVIAQDLEPQTRVPRDTPVTITVAQPPPEGCNGDGGN